MNWLEKYWLLKVDLNLFVVGLGYLQECLEWIINIDLK